MRGNHAEFHFHFGESAEEEGADLLGEICAQEIEAGFGEEAIEFAACAVDGIGGAGLADAADERIGDEFFVFGDVKAAEGEVADAGETAATAGACGVVAACIIFAAGFLALRLAF